MRASNHVIFERDQYNKCHVGNEREDGYFTISRMYLLFSKFLKIGNENMKINFCFLNTAVLLLCNLGAEG